MADMLNATGRCGVKRISIYIEEEKQQMCNINCMTVAREE